MIQIQSSRQFSRAAEKLTKERMGVRRAEAHMYEVTNKSKGTRYHVRFARQAGSLFVGCDCPAGTRHHRAPLMCKHVAAVLNNADTPTVLYNALGEGVCEIGGGPVGDSAPVIALELRAYKAREEKKVV
jgi:hypothetical protein